MLYGKKLIIKIKVKKWKFVIFILHYTIIYIILLFILYYIISYYYTIPEIKELLLGSNGL